MNAGRKGLLVAAALAVVLVAGCGGGSSSSNNGAETPETGQRASVECFKNGDAVRVSKATELPYRSVIAYSPGRKAMTAVYTASPADLKALANKITSDNNDARTWLSASRKAMGAIVGKATLADWKLMLECGAILPEDVPENRLDNTEPRLVQEAVSLAEIEAACEMPVDTAGIPLLDVAAPGSPNGFSRRYHQAILGAEAMATKTPDQLCPTLRRRAGLNPYPNQAKMVGAFNCDYLLGAGLNGPDTFVAGGTVTNKGSKDGKATVTASWELLGSDPATAVETVTVPAGGKRKVQLSREAVATEIDAHQAANGRCFVKVK